MECNEIYAEILAMTQKDPVLNQNSASSHKRAKRSDQTSYSVNSVCVDISMYVSVQAAEFVCIHFVQL